MSQTSTFGTRVLLGCLLGWLLAGPGVSFAEDQANSEWIRTAVGVTRANRAIPAWVHPALYDLESRQTRFIVIGDDPRVTDLLLSMLQADDGLGKLAQPAAVAVSFVPDSHPDRKAGDQLDQGFPPDSNAYQDPTNPEAQYLWRWIGIHGPDAVVVLKAGESHSVSGTADLRPIREWFGQRENKPAEPHSLVRQLKEEESAEVGPIPACEIVLANSNLQAELAELLRRLTEASEPRSKARDELRKRLDRTPVEVANQLSQHYGDHLNQVVYIPTLALMARLRLTDLTENPRHEQEVREIVEPYYEGTKISKPTSGSGLAGHLIYCALAERSTGSRRERYLQLARQAADLAWEQESPDSPGQARDVMPFHHEMSDSLFMGGPILAWVGKLAGEEKYYDACLQHLRYLRKLVLRDDGLYRHSPLDEAAWGRGNGFPALGLALCLEQFPLDHPGRQELREWFRTHLRALHEHQDADGCWHQVVDCPESYRELTSTCMITFSMIRGVRRGWLDEEEFDDSIDRAWKAIRLRVPPNGRLVDVCTGTGKQKTLRDYYDRKAILGRDDRGGAMALMVATEYAAYRQR